MMRTVSLITYFFLCSILISSALVLAADPNECLVQSVDIEKIRKHKYTTFIEHIFWPAEEVIASKKILKKVIPTDMREFKNALSKVFKPGYLPTEKIVDVNAVALEKYRYGGDYILLRYNIGKQEIRIHECRTLYIAIFPETEPNVARPNLAEYVKATAFKVLNLPKHDQEGKEPKVFVSSLDIGASKCGNMVYSGDPPLKFWYYILRWWSDGKNVLFSVRNPVHHVDLSKRAHPPKNLKKPRKFKKHSEPPK